MESSLHIILTVAAAVVLLWLVIKLFATPIKWALKLLFNALAGFVSLFIINFLGGFVGISISVGWISALIAGIFGMPGIILLLLIENLFM